MCNSAEQSRILVQNQGAEKENTRLHLEQILQWKWIFYDISGYKCINSAHIHAVVSFNI
jgi:hypothetical protein